MWKLTEDYCVYLCEKFGWTGKNITSHYEAHEAGLASNHGDPRHWMRLFGDSMDKFRARVDARLVKPEPQPEPVPVPVPQPEEPKYTIRVKMTTEENIQRAEGKAEVVVDFEEYVGVVVAGEMGNPPLEAGKAQAIVARTFAWPYVLKKEAIMDTSPGQSFRLARMDNKAYAPAYKAAKDTEGLSVGYKGLTVPNIYYADSNGGVVLATEEKWGKIYMPWHQHMNDPWDFAATQGKVWGHQIGMSQQGAAWAASKEGKTAAEILSFYYPETSIIPLTEKLATIPKKPAPPAPAPVVLPTLYLAKINTRYDAGLSIWSDP